MTVPCSGTYCATAGTASEAAGTAKAKTRRRTIMAILSCGLRWMLALSRSGRSLQRKSRRRRYQPPPPPPPPPPPENPPPPEPLLDPGAVEAEATLLASAPPIEAAKRPGSAQGVWLPTYHPI